MTLLHSLLVLAFAVAVTALDKVAIAKQRLGNDAAWYMNRIPFFDSSDARINDVYYYRWQVYRAHQRDLGALGYITTEFLDDVGWQLEPYASLNAATGFHLGDGRWLRDRRFADDYINFMYTVGNDRHFSDYMADSTYGRYLVDGDAKAATAHLTDMQRLFGEWNDHFNASVGMYYIEPLADATEYTVSSIDYSGGKDGFRDGVAYRPSINSYMYANAVAISKLLSLAGQSPAKYDGLAASIKNATLSQLWNGAQTHFMDRFQVGNQNVHYYDFVRNRELVGVVPFMFNLPDNNGQYTLAWKHILAPDGFQSPHGVRTVEPSYEFYMRQYRYEGSRPECQWNGPVWPYQTSMMLFGLANVLDTYTQGVVSRTDYMHLLSQYTSLHYLDGKLNIQEDYDPASGKPIVGLDRSNHYYHSSYNDVIITGLVGIRPSADDSIIVNPAITAEGIAWFRIEDVPYHGHSLTVTWDVDGKHFGQGTGLKVEADGETLAMRRDLGKLTASLPRKAFDPIDRPIAQSVQLKAGSEYPIPTASSGTNVDNLHEGIDGRVVFFADGVNGWASEPSTSESQQWYAIDFGKTVSLKRAELAFFDDGTTAALPTKYTLQSWQGSAWRDVQGGFGENLLANGIVNAHWPAVSTNQFRITFTQPPNKVTRLVEFKLF